MGAGGELLEHLLAAGGAERVQLWAEVLVVGGDTGVADQGHGWFLRALREAIFSHNGSSDETVV